MAEQPRPAALDRIERAVARIEAAAHEQRAARDAQARRHATLRTRVGDAVAALDAMLAAPGDAG